MRGKEVRECWLGDRWVPYPVQVPIFRVGVYQAFSGVSSILNASDYATTVWVGPAAPLPLPPERIQLPRQMTMRCDWFTATSKDAKEYLTSELLYHHPEISTAYLYQIIMPKLMGMDCIVVWKVWLHHE